MQHGRLYALESTPEPSGPVFRRYVTGIQAAATFGPLPRFTCGTEFAAPRLAAALAARG